VAHLTLAPLPGISPTTVLGCTATSADADGFLISHQLQYSDGKQFSTPAAVETFSSAGTYTATATVIDQFGASNSTSTTFSVGGGQVTPMLSVTLPKPAHTDQRIILQPMGTP
jgi:hypothetical protein